MFLKGFTIFDNQSFQRCVSFTKAWFILSWQGSLQRKKNNNNKWSPTKPFRLFSDLFCGLFLSKISLMTRSLTVFKMCLVMLLFKSFVSWPFILILLFGHGGFTGIRLYCTFSLKQNLKQTYTKVCVVLGSTYFLWKARKSLRQKLLGKCTNWDYL